MAPSKLNVFAFEILRGDENHSSASKTDLGYLEGPPFGASSCLFSFLSRGSGVIVVDWGVGERLG